MGWHPESVKHLMDCVAAGLPSMFPSVGPSPDLSKLPTRLRIDGREVHVLLRVHRPNVCLLSRLLSAKECAGLIELSLPKMQRSKIVVGEAEADEVGVVAYSRTSDQTSFPVGSSELVDRIQRRVAELTRWPADHMEDIQVVRYRIGADFAPHYDYFSPEVHKDIIERAGQRVATVLIYLNTPDYGGITVFPDIELEIYPHAGSALFFGYTGARADSLTLHAGVPLRSGEKWIATFFLRDRVIKKKARNSAHG